MPRGEVCAPSANEGDVGFRLGIANGERLILPIYALLVPYAGIALAAAATALRRRIGVRHGGVRAT